MKYLGWIINTDDLLYSPYQNIGWYACCSDPSATLEPKTFTAKTSAQSIGTNLASCLVGYHWLKMNLFRFQRMLQEALKKNANRLLNSKLFQVLLTEKDEAWLARSRYAGRQYTKLLARY
jgi:hypothetical protein